MAFWDFYSGYSVWGMNVLRAVILLFGLFELFMYTRKRGDLEELFSWKTKPLQEARGNLLMVGLFIIVFGLIIYMDRLSDLYYIYIPLDIVLLLLIETLYLLPKRAVIASSGVFYAGSFTPKAEVTDHFVHDRFDRLIVKGPRSLFSSNIEIPLPDDKKAMEAALERMMGKGGKKKAGKGSAGKGRGNDPDGAAGAKPKSKQGKGDKNEAKGKRPRTGKGATD